MTQKRSNSAWKFKIGDQAIDLVNTCACKVLVQNSSNVKVERRYYVETRELKSDNEIRGWRKETELKVF